jgi:hypothetical protein
MAIKPLLTKLEELAIFPEFDEGDDLSKQDGSVLIDAVKLKASELRLSDNPQLTIV